MLSGRSAIKDTRQASSADERAKDLRGLHRALLELGFKPVGVVKTVLNHPQDLFTDYSSMDRADAQKIMRRILEGEVVEVSTSHDALMFGMVESTVSDPVLSLQTIFENGVIVETTMRPTRAPRPRVGENLWQSMVAWVARMVVGDPPIWPRGNWPQAGVFVDLIESTDPDRLLDHHCAHMQEIQERFQTRIAAHNSLDVYQAIRLRFRQVSAYRRAWSNVLNYSILVLMVVAFFVLPRSQSLMDVFFVLYTAALAVLIMGVLNRLVIPELGPRPTPLPSLLERLKRQQSKLASRKSSPLSS